MRVKHEKKKNINISEKKNASLTGHGSGGWSHFKFRVLATLEWVALYFTPNKTDKKKALVACERSVKNTHPLGGG